MKLLSSTLLLALAALKLATPSLASPIAQDSDSQALEQALQKARTELAAERARINTEQAAQTTRLAELLEKRSLLSDQFVDLNLELDTLRGQLDGPRDTRTSKRADVARAKQEVSGISRLVTDAGAKVVDLLEVLPPSNGLLDPQRVDTDSVGTLVPYLSELLDATQSSGHFRTNLRTPAGEDEEVAITRVGLLAWVYESVAEKRCAVAMNAPGLDESYRWVEELPLDQIAGISRVTEAARAGTPSVVSFPIDVTVQMETESMTREETWTTTIMAGGPIMVPLAGVAALALLLILERVFFVLRKGGRSTNLAETIVDHARAGRLEEARQLCEKRKTPITRTLGACFDNRPGGVAAMEDAAQEAVLHELPGLERFLPTLAILASVAPLMGLLGTVTGMILTFEMIATLGSGNPRIMAGGISQALITTAAGLVVAIPILLAHSVIAGRVDRLIADMERFAATLLNVLREDRAS